MRREIAFAAVAVFCLALSQACRAELVEIAGADVSLFLERAGGAPSKILNRRTGEEFGMAGELLGLTTSGGALKTGAMAIEKIVPDADGGLAIGFSCAPHRLEVRFIPLKDAPFIEMRAELLAGEPVAIESVKHGRFEFTPGFDQAEALIDHCYHTPVGMVLRGEKGAVLAGAAWPLAQQSCDESGFAVEYETGVKLERGGKFEAEPFFIGVCANTGRMAFWDRPVPDRSLRAGMGAQDWGEVFAMQSLLSHYLPALHPPVDGYFAFLNSWWAGLPEQMDEKAVAQYGRAIDIMSGSRIPAMILAGNYLAMGGSYFTHSQPDPYVSHLGRDFDLKLSEPVRQVMAHGRGRGVDVCSWGIPNHPLRVGDAPPGWQSMANNDFAEWYADITLKMIGMTRGSFWGWDGGWPGSGAYTGLKNVEAYLRRLRAVYPRICLETYYGLRHACPWVMAQINAQENYFESEGIEHDRMTTWHLQNCSYTPVHKNMGAFCREAYAFKHYPVGGFEYCLVSALSGSQYMQIRSLNELAQEETSEIFRKWTTWAAANRRFLEVKRDLFGPPHRPGGALDGSAHIAGGVGYVFIFNPTRREVFGRIALDEMLLGPGLAEAYSIGLECGDRVVPIGLAGAGQSFVIRMRPRSFRALKLDPAAPGPLALSEPAAAGLSDEMSADGAVIEDAFPVYPCAADIPVLRAQRNVRYYCIGPLPAGEFKDAGWGVSAVEKEACAMTPIYSDSGIRIGGQSWRWQVRSGQNQAIAPPGAEDGVWFYRVEIFSEREIADASLLLGILNAQPWSLESPLPAAAALNGELLLSDELGWPRFWRPCRLRQGLNVLAIKVQGTAPVYCRLADAQRRPLHCISMTGDTAGNIGLASNGASADSAIPNASWAIDGRTSGYSAENGCVRLPVGSPLTVTLEQPSVIYETRTLFCGIEDRRHAYKIEASLDGREWRVLADKTGQAEYSGWQTDVFNACLALHVRITCVKCSLFTGQGARNEYGVVEFEIYGEKDE